MLLAEQQLLLKWYPLLLAEHLLVHRKLGQTCARKDFISAMLPVIVADGTEDMRLRNGLRQTACIDTVVLLLV